MSALVFETGAAPVDGVVTVRRFVSRVDGEIDPIGGPILAPPALAGVIVRGIDSAEIVIATGNGWKLQAWGKVASGLHHDRCEAHKGWKPARWAG